MKQRFGMGAKTTFLKTKSRSARRGNAGWRTGRSKPSGSRFAARLLFTCVGLILAVFVGSQLYERYTFSLQSPIRLRFQWPLVVARRHRTPDEQQARLDQHGRPLTAYQQYACDKFGTDCRVALAIQRAENPAGRCEIYHYNTDGTLDWGYFQINTVHLKRPGLNLRDLLDCKANIDFAYQLYLEKGGFTPWSTYNSGDYRKFLQGD